MKEEIIKKYTNMKGKPNAVRIKWLLRGRYPEDEEAINDLLPLDINLGLKVRMLVGGYEEVPTCAGTNCKEEVNWGVGSFQRYCSMECKNRDPNRVDQIKQTKIDRYGENYTEVLQERMKATNREKHGCDFPLQSDSIRNKTFINQQGKYGGVGFQNRAVRDRAQQTLVDKFGTKSGNAGMSDESKDAIDGGTIDRMHLEDKLSLTEISEKLDVSVSTVRKYISCDRIHGTKSRHENAVAEHLVERYPKVRIIRNDRQVIGPKELDFVLPEYNLAIEVNGMWYHSHRYLSERTKAPIQYHLNKTKACEEKGYRLIHLFEYEMLAGDKWKNVLDAALQSIDRIYARQTEVVDLTYTEVAAFLDKHHMQGRGGKTKCNYGLVYNGELVAAMTFGKPRFNKGVEYELIRLVTKGGMSVVGGANKLFNHFVKEQSPTSVLSYCDKRLFTGTVYHQMGFQYSHDSKPNYWYFNMSDPTYTPFHRAHFQKHKLAQKLDVFDPKLSEWENMVANKWNKFYDCGNSVWIWRE